MCYFSLAIYVHKQHRKRQPTTNHQSKEKQTKKGQKKVESHARLSALFTEYMYNEIDRFIDNEDAITDSSNTAQHTRRTRTRTNVHISLCDFSKADCFFIQIHNTARINLFESNY